MADLDVEDMAKEAQQEPSLDIGEDWRYTFEVGGIRNPAQLKNDPWDYPE